MSTKQQKSTSEQYLQTPELFYSYMLNLRQMNHNISPKKNINTNISYVKRTTQKIFILKHQFITPHQPTNP